MLRLPTVHFHDNIYYVMLCREERERKQMEEKALAARRKEQEREYFNQQREPQHGRNSQQREYVHNQNIQQGNNIPRGAMLVNVTVLELHFKLTVAL